MSAMTGTCSDPVELGVVFQRAEADAVRSVLALVPPRFPSVVAALQPSG